MNLDSTGDTGSIFMTNFIASGSFNITRDTGDVQFTGCDAAEINVKVLTLYLFDKISTVELKQKLKDIQLM